MSITTRTPPELPSRWAQAQAAKAEERKRTRKIAFYVSAGVIVAIALAFGIWELIGLHKAHVHQQFLNTLKGDPAKIRTAVEAGQITREEAGQMWREDGEKRMDDTLDKYFAMDAAARKQFMTEMITRAEEREKQRQQWLASNGPSTRPGGQRPNGQNPNNNPASRVAQAESRNPVRRAQMQQFFADYNAQWKQMGNPGPAPRFWGGGRGR